MDRYYWIMIKKNKASYWMLSMWTSYLITKIQFLNIYIWVWKYVGSSLDRVDICIPPSFYNESTNLKQLLEIYSNALCECRVPIYMLFDFLNHHTQESKKLYGDLTLKTSAQELCQCILSPIYHRIISSFATMWFICNGQRTDMDRHVSGAE